MSAARLRLLRQRRETAIALMLGIVPKARPTSRYRARAVWLLSDLAAQVERIDAEIAEIMAAERERMAIEQDRRAVARLAGRPVTVVEDAAA